AEVRRLTGGVDLVYDVPGAATMGPALATLRPRGRLIIGGYLSGAVFPLDLLEAIYHEWRIFGSNSWTRLTVRCVLDLIDEGRLRPVVDAVLSFEELPRGLEKMASRDLFGKIV